MTHERHLKMPGLSTTPMPATTVDASANLESVLAAWHGATVRLEQTHKILRDEVARLTTELNRKNQELARKNRLADLGQMASHVAHEVRNNLVPVALYVSLLRRRLADDDASLKVVRQIESGVAALDVTVNDLLHFTSDRAPRWEPVPMRRLVKDVFDSLSPQLHAQAIDLTIDVPKEMVVSADRDMFRRALLNLVLNAIDAMPSGGELVVTACQGPRGVELEVADSGSGLDGDVLRRVFEPFFTTKRGGTGLGLAIVYRVAEVHGGDVTALNCPEGGAAFTLRIPRPAMEAAA
jgi:signal transduction histidine kinase